MVKETRHPFTLTGTYYARRGFRLQGRDFALGDKFPWEELCSKRKLKQLYEGRFINPGDPPECVKPGDPPVQEEPVVKDPPQEDTKSPVDEPSPDEEDEVVPPPEFIFHPNSHQIKSTGGGRYEILTKGGKFRLAVTRKESQRLKRAKKRTAVRPDEIIE